MAKLTLREECVSYHRHAIGEGTPIPREKKGPIRENPGTKSPTPFVHGETRQQKQKVARQSAGVRTPFEWPEKMALASAKPMRDGATWLVPTSNVRHPIE